VRLLLSLLKRHTVRLALSAAHLVFMPPDLLGDLIKTLIHTGVHVLIAMRCDESVPVTGRRHDLDSGLIGFYVQGHFNRLYVIEEFRQLRYL
jgi:hypothetical protein